MGVEVMYGQASNKQDNMQDIISDVPGCGYSIVGAMVLVRRRLLERRSLFVLSRPSLALSA